MSRKFFPSLILITFIIASVSAETTFYEGDLGYRDDFIMVPKIIPFVQVTTEGAAPTEISTGRGGRGCPPGTTLIEGKCVKIEEQVVEEEVELLAGDKLCPMISESLREHISEKRSINYTVEDLEELTSEINFELDADFSTERVAETIANFEDVCDQPYPLSGGLALGRYRNILIFLIITVLFLLLIFLIYVGIRIRSLLKRKRGIKKAKSRKKDNVKKKH